MINEVCDKDYLDRLKELNLSTVEERRNRVDLVELSMAALWNRAGHYIVILWFLLLLLSFFGFFLA